MRCHEVLCPAARCNTVRCGCAELFRAACFAVCLFFRLCQYRSKYHTPIPLILCTASRHNVVESFYVHPQLSSDQLYTPHQRGAAQHRAVPCHAVPCPARGVVLCGAVRCCAGLCAVPYLLFRTCQVSYDQASSSGTKVHHTRFGQTTLLKYSTCYRLSSGQLYHIAQQRAAQRRAVRCAAVCRRAVRCGTVPFCAVLCCACCAVFTLSCMPGLI